MGAALAGKLILSPKALRALIYALLTGLLIPIVLMMMVFAFFARTAAKVNEACSASVGPGAAVQIGAAGQGNVVGATYYGGPTDPSSGHFGSSGVDLSRHPDSYAELAGVRPVTFSSSALLGRLPYETPLRITYRGRSAVGYKRDIGFGGGPVPGGQPRRIDLWYQLADRLGFTGTGTVRVERTPATGSANQQGLTPDSQQADAGTVDPALCSPGAISGPLQLTNGPRARLLPNGLAAAPAGAPAQVKQIIAAGNQINGRPYVYGAAHGAPINSLQPAYDCSSSVSHMLGAARLLQTVEASGALMSFGQGGLGRWVSVFSDPGHVYMYVAGLRWDTHNLTSADGPNRGVGWHLTVRPRRPGDAIRHPPRL